MRKLKTIILFILLTISLIAQTLTGKVLYVSDGDTLTMEVNGQKEKIRFFGIDAPEKTQPGGLESKEFVLNKLKNNVIEVKVTDTDRYNRKIGKIYYDDGVYLNKEIVKSGHAWWYERYARNEKDLRDAEEYAKSNKLGLWAKPSSIAPWDWRKGIRATSKDQVNDYESNTDDDRVYVTKTGEKYHNKGCRYLKSIRASYTIEEAEDRGYEACSRFVK